MGFPPHCSVLLWEKNILFWGLSGAPAMGKDGGWNREGCLWSGRLTPLCQAALVIWPWKGDGTSPVALLVPL